MLKTLGRGVDRARGAATPTLSWPVDRFGLFPPLPTVGICVGVCLLLLFRKIRPICVDSIGSKLITEPEPRAMLRAPGVAVSGSTRASGWEDQYVSDIYRLRYG